MVAVDSITSRARENQDSEQQVPPAPPRHGATLNDIADYDKRLRARQVQLHGDGRGAKAILEDSMQTVPVNAKDQLRELGIKALVAMLMTYDGAGQAKDIRIKKRDNNAQQAQAEQEIKATTQGKVTGHASDKDTKNYSAHNIVPKRYWEICIHSKLLLIDDSFFTLGSANLNLRSMAVDAEINIASDDVGKSSDLRRRVWGMLTGGTQDGGDGSPVVIAETFGRWQRLMSANSKFKDLGDAPIGFLMPFHDDRTSSIRLG